MVNIFCQVIFPDATGKIERHLKLQYFNLNFGGGHNGQARILLLLIVVTARRDNGDFPY
jgi:hypothetical protein